MTQPIRFPALWATLGFALVSLLLVGYSGPQAVPATHPMYTGINLAGPEFTPQKLPGVYNTDYFYPSQATVDYYLSKGMNILRLPFLWERLQPVPNGDFDAAEQGRITDFVTYATGKGATVILDLHNYARYYAKVIGKDVPASVFAVFWAKLATLFKDNSKVVFGLMNEPNTMPTKLWRDDANAAIAAIRGTGALNLILVPGNAWSGAWSWTQTWYGMSNASAMRGIKDTANNYAFDVHQFLDKKSSGGSAQCVNASSSAKRLAALTAWLHKYGKHAIITEFAGSQTPACYAALDSMLAYVDAHTDVYLGWTAWAGGGYWGNYVFSLDPDAVTGADKPQMAYLLKHMALP